MKRTKQKLEQDIKSMVKHIEENYHDAVKSLGHADIHKPHMVDYYRDKVSAQFRQVYLVSLYFPELLSETMRAIIKKEDN